MSYNIKVEVEFEISDIVYQTTDVEQEKYMVLGYAVRHNEVLYELYNHNNGSYVAYGFELSKTREL